MSKLTRGWSVLVASWGVLKERPKLLFLPLLSGVAMLVVLVVSLLGLWAVFGMPQPDRIVNKDIFQGWTLRLLAFAFYFVNIFIVVFFNAALTYCAMACFRGEEPSISDGVVAASLRMPQILGWALVASTVGVILNALESTLENQLSWVGSLFGVVLRGAWAAATFFVIPALVVEGVGPVKAIGRSTAMIRQTWGEAASARLSIGLIAFLLAFLGAPMIIVSSMAGSAVVLQLGVGAAVLYWLALTMVFSTLITIFRAGAYVLATTGNPPPSMDAGAFYGVFS
jgi:hypothetical protein